MKLFRIVRDDIIRGIYSAFPYLAVLEAFYILVSISFSSEMSEWMDLLDSTIGDQLIYTFAGMKEYIPTPNEAFSFPVLWVLLYALILFVPLRYMTEDLLGFGQKNMVCMQSRIIWWLSKCVSNLCTSIFAFVLCYVTITLSTLIRGSRIELTVSPQILMIVEEGIVILPPEEWNIAVEVLAMPVLIGVTLSILQMVLSLVVKPVCSYIIMIILLIGSTYYQSPYLIGNYAMTIRSSQITANGVDPIKGSLLACGVMIISVVAGILIIQKKDILGEEMHIV